MTQFSGKTVAHYQRFFEVLRRWFLGLTWVVNVGALFPQGFRKLLDCFSVRLAGVGERFEEARCEHVLLVIGDMGNRAAMRATNCCASSNASGRVSRANQESPYQLPILLSSTVPRI